MGMESGDGAVSGTDGCWSMLDAVGVYSLGGVAGDDAALASPRDSEVASDWTASAGGVQSTYPKQYMPGPQSSSNAEGQGASQASWAVCQLEPQ